MPCHRNEKLELARIICPHKNHLFRCLYSSAVVGRDLTMRDRKFNGSREMAADRRVMNFYDRLGKRFSICSALSICAMCGNGTDCRHRGAYNKTARLPIALVPGRRANYGNAPRHVSLITREFVSSVSCSTCPPTMPTAGIMNLNLSLNITSTHALLADGISTESGDRHANAQ